MKINLDTVIRDLTGKAFKDGDGEAIKDLTLGRLACLSLLNDYQDKPKTSGQKVDDYLLGVRVNNGGVLELKTEEVARIKEMIARGFPTLIVGVAFGLLENGGVDPHAAPTIPQDQAA